MEACILSWTEDCVFFVGVKMDLKQFFENNPKVALAFSGGVDSAYLLYAAKKYGATVTPYYVRSAFQPEFEYNDALRLCRELGTEMRTIKIDVLADPIVASNPSDRCYYCKKQVFGNILKEASKDGYKVIIDGTNASDREDDRPGFKALKELEVRSPLRECGLTKDMIRELSKEAGLFTWDKPAYACLATRIKTGEEITKEKLEKTEVSEGFLMDLGFRDLRVRQSHNNARLEINEKDMDLYEKNKELIVETLKKHYSSVDPIPEVRR